MKALMIAAGALLAMTAVASAQPTQLTAAAMDRVAAGGTSTSFSIPCPDFNVKLTVPCPDFNVKLTVPCPNFVSLTVK